MFISPTEHCTGCIGFENMYIYSLFYLITNFAPSISFDTPATERNVTAFRDYVCGLKIKVASAHG